MRRLIPLGILGLILFSACESESLTSTDIVEDIPWSPPEFDNYRVLDDSGDEVGTLTLAIEAADNGGLRLRQDFDFPDAGFVNSADVIVDEVTVRPRSVSFQITGPEGDLMCGAAYVDGKVIAERVGEDETRTDELNVPQIAYDSWSDLFLWRTIAFAEGYSVEYTDIAACTLARTQKLGTTLKVAEREEIEVPAGAFEVWRLEIDSGGAGQTAWYTTDQSHRLIKYDNGRETFEAVD